MKANYHYRKEESSMKEVDLGTTLYDMNKQLMAQREPMTATEITETLPELIAYIQRNAYQQYFMLLCNERKDYTVFNLMNTYECEYGRKSTAAANDVILCMQNRGELMSMQFDEEGGGWELWMKDTQDECFVYYFFPYGSAVIEY